ncbi:MAG: hypothetical protein ACD_3C00026G0001 [uncultured bacterium (gcode 4)]|uniref:GTPase Der n=1 Tax=uncultured bacterium (gcode 4) TaxID=1234023 RepID=K2GZ20_9BACT|nr:MAG: hypothetical protein ACD_3C00026G0001 [uncultured bacterium (gcode 4)]
MLGRVTIVGRPNVGKSSLFNAISGHRIAIVSDIENTTRDIIEYLQNDEDNEISYIIADSGWLTSGSNDEILNDVRKRVQESIEKSDLVIFVTECDKITDLDETITKILRKSWKEVIVVWNKADNQNKVQESYGLYSLWFEDVIFASVSHRRWISELRETIAAKLKKLGLDTKEEKYDDSYIKLAIVGRPNVGKSSIINAVTWEDKVMVRDMPGTTRDAVDTLFEYNDKKFVLIDTAWIRRAWKIGVGNIEDWSVMRSEVSITRADIVAIVMDWFDWITAWDQHIVEKALEEKKWIILVVNKWDKVLAKPGIDKDKMMDEYMYYLKQKFEFLAFASPIFTSAVTGKRLEEILESAIKIKEERQKRVKTSVFNSFIEQIVYKHPPTWNKKSHKPKIYYGSQVDINPPRFLISVNSPSHFHFSYTRYIENKIREFFGFWWTPIEIELKWRESIYKKSAKKNIVSKIS